MARFLVPLPLKDGEEYLGDFSFGPYAPDRKVLVSEHAGEEIHVAAGTLRFAGTYTIPQTDDREFAQEVELFRQRIHEKGAYTAVPTKRTGFADAGGTTTGTSNPDGNLIVRSAEVDSETGAIRVVLQNQNAQTVPGSRLFGRLNRNPRVGDYVTLGTRLSRVIGLPVPPENAARTPILLAPDTAGFLAGGAILSGAAVFRGVIEPGTPYVPTPVSTDDHYGPWSIPLIEDLREEDEDAPDPEVKSPIGTVVFTAGDPPKRVRRTGRLVAPDGSEVNLEQAVLGDAITVTDDGDFMLFSASRPSTSLGYLRGRTVAGGENEDLFIVKAGAATGESPTVLGGPGVTSLDIGEPYSFTRSEFIQGSDRGTEQVIEGNDAAISRREIQGDIHSGVALEPGSVTLQITGANAAGEASVDAALEISDTVFGSPLGGPLVTPGEVVTKIERYRDFAAQSIRPGGRGFAFDKNDHFRGPNPFTITIRQQVGHNRVKEPLIVGNQVTIQAADNLSGFPLTTTTTVIATDTVTKETATGTIAFQIHAPLPMAPLVNGPANQLIGGTTGETQKLYLTGGTQPVVRSTPQSGTLTIREKSGTTSPDPAGVVTYTLGQDSTGDRRGNWFIEFTRINADTTDLGTKITIEASNSAGQTDIIFRVRCRAAGASEGEGPTVDRDRLLLDSDGNAVPFERIDLPYAGGGGRGVRTEWNLNQAAVSPNTDLDISIEYTGSAMATVQFDDWTIDTTPHGFGGGNVLLKFRRRTGDTTERVVTIPYNVHRAGNQPPIWSDLLSTQRQFTVGVKPSQLDLSNNAVRDPETNTFAILTKTSGDPPNAADFDWTPKDIATPSLSSPPGQTNNFLLDWTTPSKAGIVDLTLTAQASFGNLAKSQKIYRFTTAAAPTVSGVPPRIDAAINNDLRTISGRPIYIGDTLTIIVEQYFSAGPNGQPPDFSRNTVSVGNGSILSFLRWSTGRRSAQFRVVGEGTSSISGRVFETGTTASTPWSRNVVTLTRPAVPKPVWITSRIVSLFTRRNVDITLWDSADPTNQNGRNRIAYTGSRSLSFTVASVNYTYGSRGSAPSSAHGITIAQSGTRTVARFNHSGATKDTRFTFTLQVAVSGLESTTADTVSDRVEYRTS